MSEPLVSDEKRKCNLFVITLLHPSRGRPDKSRETVRNWIVKGKFAPRELIVSLDKSDPLLHRYLQLYDNHYITINDNKSVVEATNHAAKISRGNILIYLSDDFDCPDNWAELVEQEFAKYTGPILIKVDDCLQSFHVPVLTIPIMNRECYEALGYFWYPEYKSMHVDVDLYHTVKKRGYLKMAPHLKFPHNHVSNGKAQDDDTYRRSAANWDQGLEVINRRKAAGFP